MTTAGPAGVPAMHVGPFFPPRPGLPMTNPWLVFALVGQWGPLTRVFGWLVVTWQRIRTFGGVSPSAITVPLAGHGETATDPVKVLVNALRAVHRVAGTLIRWLVARTTVFAASAVTMSRVPSRRSTPQYGHRSGRS